MSEVRCLHAMRLGFCGPIVRDAKGVWACGLNCSGQINDPHYCGASTDRASREGGKQQWQPKLGEREFLRWCCRAWSKHFSSMRGDMARAWIGAAAKRPVLQFGGKL